MSELIDTTKMMVTSQGKYFSPWEIDVGDIDIDDIANGLSKLCRYAGQCNGFYSVAQHSVIMANQVYAEHRDLQLARIALLHDAPEAYISDLVRCVKERLPDHRDLDYGIWCAVVQRFQLEPLWTEIVKGVSVDLPPEVHEADMRMVVTERKALIGENRARWRIETEYEPYAFNIKPWSWLRAYQEFLNAFGFYFK